MAESMQGKASRNEEGKARTQGPETQASDPEGPRKWVEESQKSTPTIIEIMPANQKRGQASTSGVFIDTQKSQQTEGGQGSRTQVHETKANNPEKKEGVRVDQNSTQTATYCEMTNTFGVQEGSMGTPDYQEWSAETEEPEDFTPRRITRVWGNWGEYTLDPKWRVWALEALGVQSKKISVDLFASPWDAAAPLYITKAMNAFTFDWASLSTGPDDLLWANPPFGLLDRVANKLSCEPCQVVLCTPEWECENWWWLLESLPHRRERLPPKVKLFYGSIKKTALPQKAWRTCVWLIDTREYAPGKGSERSEIRAGGKPRGLNELRQEVAKLPRVVWSHGYQGGKPMQPECEVTERHDAYTYTEDREPKCDEKKNGTQ